MPAKKEIIYPIFLECCQYTEDSFWESIFDDLAYGKAPYGSYISKDFLCCSYKGKEFTYKITRKDPKELYTDIYNLFVEKLGVLSEREKNKKLLDFYDLERDIMKSRETWRSIRKKNVKDIMYEKYVIEMKQKHSLTIKQAKYLLSVILMSMMFKSITSKDIHYNGDKIDRIDGIDFENGEIVLKRSITSPLEPLSETPEVSDVSKCMFNNWEKHVRTLKKRAL
jgi:hypothetical protein